MPTLSQVRTAITTRVNAYWPTTYPAVKLYYDNAYPQSAEVDALSEYVLCSIQFTGGAQMDISPDPNHRVSGRIVFTAACREGAGSLKVLGYLDGLAAAMKFAQFGGVNTKEPRPGVQNTSGGWFSYDLSIPFHADSFN